MCIYPNAINYMLICKLSKISCLLTLIVNGNDFYEIKKNCDEQCHFKLASVHGIQLTVCIIKILTLLQSSTLILSFIVYYYKLKTAQSPIYIGERAFAKSLW